MTQQWDNFTVVMYKSIHYTQTLDCAEFENDTRLNRSGKEWENWGDCVTTLAKQFWTHWSFRISLDAVL